MVKTIVHSRGQLIALCLDGTTQEEMVGRNERKVFDFELPTVLCPTNDTCRVSGAGGQLPVPAPRTVFQR